MQNLDITLKPNPTAYYQKKTYTKGKDLYPVLKKLFSKSADKLMEIGALSASDGKKFKDAVLIKFKQSQNVTEHLFRHASTFKRAVQITVDHSTQELWGKSSYSSERMSNIIQRYGSTLGENIWAPLMILEKYCKTQEAFFSQEQNKKQAPIVNQPQFTISDSGKIPKKIKKPRLGDLQQMSPVTLLNSRFDPSELPEPSTPISTATRYSVFPEKPSGDYVPAPPKSERSPQRSQSVPISVKTQYSPFPEQPSKRVVPAPPKPEGKKPSLGEMQRLSPVTLLHSNDHSPMQRSPSAPISLETQYSAFPKKPSDPYVLVEDLPSRHKAPAPGSKGQD